MMGKGAVRFLSWELNFQARSGEMTVWSSEC